MHSNFKTSNYFSGMPYILGFILTPIGFALLFSPQFVIGAILILTGVIIITTHYRISIDNQIKKYSEYVSLLGIKCGTEVHAFEEIKYVFIKKSKVTQTLNSRVSSATIRKDQFDGFLKFSEDDKVHILSSENKNAVVKRLRAIASMLNVRVVDYSAENPIEIK